MRAAFIPVTLALAGAGLVLWLAANPDEKGQGLPRGKHGKNVNAQGTGRLRVTVPAGQKSGQRDAGAIPLKQSSAAMNAPEGRLPAVEERNLSAAMEQEASSGPKPPGVRAKLPDKLRPPEMPLVFREVEEAAVSLEPAQAAAAAAVQDVFADQVGPEPGDPSAPDYRNHWQHEQSVADQRLRAMIGAQAYARWRREAYLRSRKTTPDRP